MYVVPDVRIESKAVDDRITQVRSGLIRWRGEAAAVHESEGTSFFVIIEDGRFW